MPKKIRELKKALRDAGFEQKKGKGSHTNWVHPKYSGKVTLSGKDGNDAKRYQEKEIQDAIRTVKNE
jgi:predicted RNA binding protein YcfA (HicA-like mRNA interferase family)